MVVGMGAPPMAKNGPTAAIDRIAVPQRSDPCLDSHRSGMLSRPPPGHLMQFDQLGRREFITLLGGTMAAWPLAARAQQTMPVLGFLGALSPEGFNEPMRGFRQGLRESGFIEAENLRIEYRWAENQIDRLPALAADLVSRRVAAIAAVGGPPSIRAAKAATATIPVVFITGDDPIRLGYVTNLARPEGNLTGVSFFNAELAAKRVALLRELVPAAARVDVLLNLADSPEATLKDLERPARAMGMQLQVLNAATAARSMRPSTRLSARGRTRYSSAPAPIFSVAACNWPI